MDTDRDDEWQRVQVDAMLQSVVDEATAGDQSSTSGLTLPEVRALLDHRLQGEATRADFRTGAITMCSLVPMRAVPHRLVCLLGIDAGVFPRPSPADGEDLLRHDPLIGDRDAAWEDRQLLLDALLSATERCIITCSGHDPRTNEAIAPAVPLAELAAAIDATMRDGHHSTGSVAAAITVDHPLHPFDLADHRPDPVTGHPWSFDPIMRRAAARSEEPTAPAAPFLADPLPPPTVTELALDDLLRTVTHPVREFLRQRLGISTWQAEHRVDDELRVELDSLEKWAVGDRMVRRLLRGDDPDAVRRAELHAGGLPPGAPATAALTEISGRAATIVERTRHLGLGGDHHSEQIDVALDGLTLSGTVPGIVGTTIAATTYSSLRARQRLTAWIHLVALTAADPETAWSAVTVGRWGAAARAVRFAPLGASTDERSAVATGHLSTLVELWRDAMQAPMPLPLATSEAYASTVRNGSRSATAAMAKEWVTSRDPQAFDREDADPAHVIAFGSRITVDELRRRHSAAGFTVADLATRLWTPVLDAEEIT